MKIDFVFPAGIIDDNFNGETLVNNTSKEVFVTVPTRERWLIMSAAMHNGDNVTRGCSIVTFNSSTNQLMILYSGSLAAGAVGQYPNGTYPYSPFILKGGQKIRFSWDAGGASAGGTARRSVRVSKLRMHESYE